MNFYTILHNFSIDFLTNYEKYIERNRENDDGAPYVFFVSHLTAVCCSALMKKKFNIEIASESNSGMERERNNDSKWKKKKKENNIQNDSMHTVVYVTLDGLCTHGVCTESRIYH